MSTVLLKELAGITGSGQFHSTGTAPFFLPGLVVEGAGEVAFPLPAAQAKELAAVAETAPYGRGEETLHDDKVRKCLQIDASQFSIRSPEWAKLMKKTLERIRTDMGIKGKISAHPYKLLIKDWGFCDVEVWRELHKAFGIETFAALDGQLFGADAAEHRALLLNRLEALLADKKQSAAAESAASLAAALAKLSPPSRHRSSWYRGAEFDAPRREIRLMLAAGEVASTKAGRKRALEFVLGDRSLDHVRDLLGPVLIEKPVARLAARTGTLAAEAHGVAVRLLEKECGRKLAPYPDWRRPFPKPDRREPVSPWRTRLEDGEDGEALQELEEFMADRSESEHGFAYRQHIRTTLEQIIRERQLDLDCTTVRRGSPHTLLCVKNDNSYQRALQQRKHDGQLLDKLRPDG